MNKAVNSAKSTEIIHINLWDNEKGAYVPLVALSQRPGERDMLYVTKPPLKPGDRAELPVGVEPIDRESATSVPLGLKHLLGGVFANKIIAAKFPDWEQLNEFERLIELGSRNVGHLQVKVVSSNAHPDRAPVIGEQELRALMGELELAIGANDLRNLLTEKNFHSVVNTHGSTLKVEYQDDDGDRWIVKRGAALDGAEYENALSNFQADANIACCSTKTFTHEGVSYLMVKRYDVAEPFKGQGESNPRLYDHAVKREVVSLKTLMQLEDIKGNSVRPCYADIIPLIAKYTASQQDVADRLYARAVFNTLTKNHEYSVDSIALIKTGSGYELSPAPAASFNMSEDRSPLPLAQQYPYRQMIDFSDRFYNAVAGEFGLQPSRVKQITEMVAGGLLSAEKKAQLYGLNEVKSRTLASHLENGGHLKLIKENSQAKYTVNINELTRTATPTMTPRFE